MDLPQLPPPKTMFLQYATNVVKFKGSHRIDGKFMFVSGSVAPFDSIGMLSVLGYYSDQGYKGRHIVFDKPNGIVQIKLEKTNKYSKLWID